MKKASFLLFIFFVQFIHATSSAQNKDLVLVEAESFSDKGGWLTDQQFMDQMGSPFLLAHGWGNPVKDASTAIELPKKGVWHVYVRTWNWCAPWNTTESPGRFRILVNDQVLENELGTGKQWGWEYAGTTEIKNQENTVTLHDLTGFEGRCDAILFSRSKDVKFPNEGEEMRTFRNKLLGLPASPENGGTYDLVVVGAGTAGLCAAIKGAREGLRVALIHNRPVPGGNNSVEVKVVASGKLNVEPYPKLGDVIREIGNVYRTPDKTEEMIKAEKNLRYFPNMHAFAVKKENGKIISVTAKNIETSRELSFQAPLFVDCSGDANLGYLAEAEYRVGREIRQETRETLAPDRADNIVLGATISWNSGEKESPVSFPTLPWAIQFNEESCEKVFSGSNWWEAGFQYDQVRDAEYIRDYLFRAIYGNWAFLKNNRKFDKEYAKRELAHVAFIAGKRESRRLVGDMFFCQQDIEKEYIKYNDAIVTGTYSIDQHFPTPKNTFFFPGEEFISTMKHGFNDLGTPRRYLRDDQVNPPYRIPYRCLYSKNVENLFMAGRNISVSHIALSSTRVQGTTGMMGELVAIAATLCKKYRCSPREIYTDHLDELLSLLK